MTEALETFSQAQTNTALPLPSIRFYGESKRDLMKNNALLFCAMLFVSAILIADPTTVKLLSYRIEGAEFLLPASTFAFSASFLATDVMCEVTGGRSFANKVLLLALFFRVLSIFYYHFIIGGDSGHILFFDLPSLWTPVKQEHLRFVLGATARVAIAGLCSAGISFLVDTYLFNGLRKRLINKNLYWFKNGVTTMAAQLINSTIFISLAFGETLGVVKILFVVLGQFLIKVSLAWLDTPLALILRNYGQGRVFWYAFWKKDFYLG